MRAKQKLAVEKPSGVATHGADLNERTSQSADFTCRVLRITQSCEAIRQFVTPADCVTADVQQNVTFFFYLFFLYYFF